MTRRKLSYPLEKVTLELREGDFDLLARLYGRQHVRESVRNLIIRHLNQIHLAYTTIEEDD